MKTKASVSGERTVARVVGPRSLAVRMQSVLAAAVVLGIGAAVLVWYYAHLGDDATVRAASATVGVRNAAASEMKLPALQVPPTPPPPAASPPRAEGETRNVDATPAAQGWAAPHGESHTAADRSGALAAGTEAQRRQVAPVLVRSSSPQTANSEAVSAAQQESTTPAEPTRTAARSPGAATLGDALQPTMATPVEAGLLTSRRWLLPKGSFLDCTLETAIDSTFAGLATCILATDVFGADGRVVLMERGTKLIGETRSDVRLGQARVAVLWDEARTPAGVVMNLASPGTDALGRAGVAGTVDRHTAERFGAAVLLSLLDVGAAALAAHGQGAGVIIYGAQESRDVATEVLRNTITIPPTIRVAPGARLTVTVVRDIDFRAVYRLVPHEKR
jgi:type IV secretion system protein VirB10